MSGIVQILKPSSLGSSFCGLMMQERVLDKSTEFVNYTWNLSNSLDFKLYNGETSSEFEEQVSNLWEIIKI